MRMKKKRFYEKPEMQVFEFEQQPQILAGSFGANASLDDPEDYIEGGNPLIDLLQP